MNDLIEKQIIKSIAENIKDNERCTELQNAHTEYVNNKIKIQKREEIKKIMYSNKIDEYIDNGFLDEFYNLVEKYNKNNG